MSECFSPLPPDAFAYNGVLEVSALELGIAPRTAATLKQLGCSQLLQAIADLRQTESATEREKPLGDEAVARDLSEQIARATPILVFPAPSKKP